jgi:hypothetical protein
MIGGTQTPFFRLLSKVTFRYAYRGGFLGSFTIDLRSSLPSAKVFNRKRSSPSCTTSILVGFFAMIVSCSECFGKACPARSVERLDCFIISIDDKLNWKISPEADTVLLVQSVKEYAERLREEMDRRQLNFTRIEWPRQEQPIHQP